MNTTLDQHIRTNPNVRRGRPCLDGTRISVDDIAMMHLRMRMSVEELVAEYELDPAAVYAALAYYYDHKLEIDDQIASDGAYVAAFKRDNPSLLREKLKAISSE